MKKARFFIAALLLIPLRAACEALGASVEWDSATKTAHIDSAQFYTFNSDFLPAS